MGTYTVVTGEITITPPLKWSEFRQHDHLLGGPNDGSFSLTLGRTRTEKEIRMSAQMRTGSNGRISLPFSHRSCS